MKKIALGFGLVMLVASCGGDTRKVSSVRICPVQTDSSAVCSEADTLEEEYSWVAEEVIPATADESFVDFFYNFASDSEFQYARVLFPLTHYQDQRIVRISAGNWKYDPMFSAQQAYTVLFDKEKDMEMEKDSAVNSVQVDLINLDKELIRRYYFERKENRWYLEAVNDEKLAGGEPGRRREDFYSFYKKFSSDSLFQLARLYEPLSFVTVDPEDEFQIFETTLDKEQWFYFRPPMTKGKLTNVHYGQEEQVDSDYKIVEFKGFGNGFSNILYFRRVEGLWRLMKFEDLSD